MISIYSKEFINLVLVYIFSAENRFNRTFCRLNGGGIDCHGILRTVITRGCILCSLCPGYRISVFIDRGGCLFRGDGRIDRLIQSSYLQQQGGCIFAVGSLCFNNSVVDKLYVRKAFSVGVCCFRLMI